jgi:hypothetical protein
MNARWLAAGVLVAAVGAGGVIGYRAMTAPPAAEPARSTPLVSTAVPPPRAGASDAGIETVGDGDDAAAEGTTPMAQRVAVIGLLNKRNGESREMTLKPGQAARIGDTIVRLRACEETAPWEQEHLTGAFVQVDVRGIDKHWRRSFSGWLYKELPELNVVQHPVYDVWTKSCTMSWPATGPDTTTLASPEAGRSSAKKSPADDGADTEDAPTTPSSAPVSNAT